MPLLVELPFLAASERRGCARLERATSPIKNRVWGFSERRVGRLWSSRPLRRRTATGYRGCGYKTVLGRGIFLSPDPLGHAASMDLYSYCNGDPVNFLDPEGRDATMADLISNGTLPKYGANVVGSPTYNAGTPYANAMGQQYADASIKYGAIIGTGLAVGTGSGAIAAGGIRAAIWAGASPTFVSNSVIALGGLGIASAVLDIRRDPSPENIVYNVSAIGGGAFAGSFTARSISAGASLAGDGPPVAGWPPILDKAWLDKSGRINPLQFLYDLTPFSKARPMATGPDMWGNAGGIAFSGMTGTAIPNLTPVAIGMLTGKDYENSSSGFAGDGQGNPFVNAVTLSISATKDLKSKCGW